MKRITESGLRSLVRQIITEAAGASETVAVTNSLRTKITVHEVRAASADQGPNLISDPVEIGPGDTKNITFIPQTADSLFLISSKREQGTGVTKGYRREGLISMYTLGEVSVTVGDGFSDDAGEFSVSDIPDSNEMTADEIAPLARVGEKYELVEDPTDPEFAYAVFYTIVPTRAVVVRAPVADYKGQKLVNSRGQEISPRRYSKSFKTVADALLAKMKDS